MFKFFDFWTIFEKILNCFKILFSETQFKLLFQTFLSYFIEVFEKKTSN